MEFVIQVLEEIFEKSREEALQITLAIHSEGSGVCGIYDEQLHALKLVEKITALATERQFPLTCAIQPTMAYDVQFVSVEENVKLEVVDWGGTGRALVFLAGLGNNAHVFSKFAPKLTANYHVYGITRRGFGASSAPAPNDGNYTADRLGDDVLAVMGCLRIDRPVLIGHSISGQELSSVGSRYPDKVAGLIYLDAWPPYDSAPGNIVLDLLDLKRLLEQWYSNPMHLDQRIVEELLSSFLQIEKHLQKMKELFQQVGDIPQPPPFPPISKAIIQGVRKYTEIPVPILAIYADPLNLNAAIEIAGLKDKPAAKAIFEAHMRAGSSAITNAIESGFPSARVIRLPNADHYVFASNEADVLREINAFLAELP